MTNVENGKISSTMLGYEDHGILTCWLHIEGSGWGCGFGGHALDQYNPAFKERRGTAYGTQFIIEVLKVLEVSSWEKLKGTYCRVETEGLGGGIIRIGHLLKNQWFNPKDLAKKMGL